MGIYNFGNPGGILYAEILPPMPDTVDELLKYLQDEAFHVIRSGDEWMATDEVMLIKKHFDGYLIMYREFLIEVKTPREVYRKHREIWKVVKSLDDIFEI